MATHRAASSSEPYYGTACWSSCSWYSGERRHCLRRTHPVVGGSVAAWRRAPRRAGSTLATPGIASSKTVAPAGTAPSAPPSAPRSSLRRRRCSLRGTPTGDMPLETRTPSTMRTLSRRRTPRRTPSRTRRRAPGSRGLGDRRDALAGQRHGSCESESDGTLLVLGCCRSRLQSRRRGVASTYAVFDMPTICASS